MIIVDTGAILALLDADDRHHETIKQLHETEGASWVLPWAILPEVDYLASTRLGAHVANAFIEDVKDGVFPVEAMFLKDIAAAAAIIKKHRALKLGLVDAVVMAQSERLNASAILTLDRRHFHAVKLKGSPQILP